MEVDIDTEKRKKCCTVEFMWVEYARLIIINAMRVHAKIAK